MSVSVSVVSQGVGALVTDLSGRCVGCGVLGVEILAGSHGCTCSDIGVSVVVVFKRTSSPSSTQAGTGSVGVQVLAGNPTRQRETDRDRQRQRQRQADRQ